MTAALINEPTRMTLNAKRGLAPQWLRPITLAIIIGLHLALLVTMAASSPPVVTALGAVEVVMVAEGDSVAAPASKAVVQPVVKPPVPLPTPAPPPPPPPPPPPVVQPVAPPPPPPVSVPLPLKAAPDPVVLPPPPPKVDLQKLRMKQERLHKAAVLKELHLKELARKKLQRQKLQRQALEHERAVQKQRLRDKQMARARAAARASAASRARRQGARHAVAALNGISPATYGRIILMRIQAHKFFPPQARAQGVTGTVGIAFLVGGSGRVAQAHVTRSSGSSILDNAARRIVMSVQAPPPPHGSFRGSTSIRFAFH